MTDKLRLRGVTLNADALAGAPSALTDWPDCWPRDAFGNPATVVAVRTGHAVAEYRSRSGEVLLRVAPLHRGLPIVGEVPSTVILALAIAALRVRLLRCPSDADEELLQEWLAKHVEMRLLGKEEQGE